jgi:hypothetical protein
LREIACGKLGFRLSSNSQLKQQIFFFFFFFFFFFLGGGGVVLKNGEKSGHDKSENVLGEFIRLEPPITRAQILDSPKDLIVL